jgi:VTC domain
MTPGSAEETLSSATRAMRPVSLEDVLTTAELQTRVDRKYVVPIDLFAAVLDELAGDLAVLQIGDLRLFRYESVYFDTPELATYRQHAHGRRRRVKIRTRAYLDSGECTLEFKRVGSRGETVKERYPYHLAARHRLDVDALALAHERVGKLVGTATLDAVLTTAYHRATLVDPAQGNRVTCDVNLRFESPDHCFGPWDRFVLVESKTTGADSPVDRALRRLGSRPLSLSKYCVGMAVLDPRLPANRWNRELRAHFDWTPSRPDAP